MNEQEIFKQFEKARSSLGFPPSGALIPNDAVSLYEIAEVLSVLGKVTADGACEALLDALVGQELIPKMLENGAVVPQSEWSQFRNMGVSAHDSGFLFGGAQLVLHDDEKLRGNTPVLERDTAARWIVQTIARFRTPQGNVRAKDASEAIDQAKGFFGAIDGEPKVSSDFVLLREVIQALEILLGYSDFYLRYGTRDEAPQLLLDALKSGALRARALREGDDPSHATIIPKPAWPTPRQEDGQTAHSISFWHGVIRFHQDCEGFVGYLPIIPRKESECWLSKIPDDFECGKPVEGIVSDALGTFSTEEDLTAWYRDVRLPDFIAMTRADRPNAAERSKEIVARDAVGNEDRRERARRIRTATEPSGWRSSGRPTSAGK